MKRKTKKPKINPQAVSAIVTEFTLLDALTESWNSAASGSGGRTTLELATDANLHVLTVRKQLKAMLGNGKARVGFETRSGIDNIMRKVPVYFLVE